MEIGIELHDTAKELLDKVLVFNQKPEKEFIKSVFLLGLCSTAKFYGSKYRDSEITDEALNFMYKEMLAGDFRVDELLNIWEQ